MDAASALPDRPTSAGWYLVAFGLLGCGLAIALTGWNQMVEVIETMQRRVLPGTHEVALTNGRTTIYYEHQARVGDKHYSSPPDLTFRCSVTDLAGTPYNLMATGPAKTRYSVSDFSGRSVLEVDIAVPGAYMLSCDGSQPYVLAVGGGLGAWLIVAIAGGSFPGLAGVIVIVFVTIKRRRWRARNPGVKTDT
jgi:hypothetical protein